MQPLTVTNATLDGMAKGMAKIQQCTPAALALISRHYLGLQFA